MRDSLRRLVAATRIELATASRNRTLVYSLLAPLVLAAAFGAVFARLTEVRPRLVVAEDLPGAVAAELGRNAVLLRVRGPDEVRDAVSREDDAIGVVLRDGRLALLTHGDEQPAMVELAGAAAADAELVLEGRPPRPLEVERYGGGAEAIEGWRRAARSTLALFGMLVGMLAVSFGLMEDRVGRTLAAVEVSPLGRGEYLAAKSLAGAALTATVTLLSLALSGSAPDWGQALATALASTAPAVGLGLVLGLHARSDVQLLSLVKATGLLLVAPIVAMLVPSGLHPALYWMPTYWAGRGYGAALGGGGWAAVGLACGLTLVLGLALLVVGRAVARRRLALGA